MWTNWMDLSQPGLKDHNDVEAIADIVEASTCKDPVTIECRTATPDHTSSKKVHQKVECNLWTGLRCLASENKEPMCYNYETRLGCLEQSTECGM